MSFRIKYGLAITLITAVSLVCFSPIDNEKEVMSQEEVSKKYCPNDQIKVKSVV